MAPPPCPLPENGEGDFCMVGFTRARALPLARAGIFKARGARQFRIQNEEFRIYPFVLCRPFRAHIVYGFIPGVMLARLASPPAILCRPFGARREFFAVGFLFFAVGFLF